jgi:16S rRNA (guanine1516-N2)-methyltransferase
MASYITFDEGFDKTVTDPGGSRNAVLALRPGPRHAGRVRLAVTTPLAPTPAADDAAREAAGRRGLPFVRRGNLSLAELAGEAGVDALLVLGAHASLWVEGVEERWHPGMGALRAKRLAIGERVTGDTFLAAARLRPGDLVLDCTIGLGADALVAATAVGSAGRVVGLESSPAIAAWTGEGFARLPGEAASRVRVECADHEAWLAAAPDRAFDVVVFDPMFRRARPATPGFDFLRRLADPRPLARSSLDQARRVARRGVLVKDGTPGWDLARLSLAPLDGRRGADRLYAWVDAA